LRYAVLALAVAMQSLTFGILTYSFTFWVEPWTDHFDVSRSQVMAIVTAHMISLGVCSALLGPLIDKIQARLAVITGLAAFSLGMAAISTAESLWLVVAVYVLIMPIGAVLAGPLMAMALVARNFNRRRGLAFGIASTGTSLGGVIFPYVTASLLVGIGWRGAHLWLAVVPPLILLPAAWFALRGESGNGSNGATREASAATTVTPAQLIRTREFWLLSLAYLFVGFTFGSLQFNLRPHVSDIGIALQESATIASAMSLAMVTGKLGTGALMDRFNHHLLFAAGCAAMVLGAALLLVGGELLSMLVGYSMLGLGAGAFLPLKAGLFSSVFGVQAVGRSMGLAQPIVTLYALGPPLTAWIRDSSGGYSTGIIIASLGAVISIPLILGLRHPRAEIDPAS
jgi:MFS family permease